MISKMAEERILTPSDLEDAAKSEVCQPILYSSIPSTAKVEPRKEVRGIGKDVMVVVKECAECSKKIKKAKKAFVCKCKEVLHCSYDCKQASQHECQGGRKPWFMSLEELGSRIKDTKDEREKFNPNGTDLAKYKSLDDMVKKAESGDPATAYQIGVSYSLRISCSVGNSKKSPIPIYMP